MGRPRRPGFYVAFETSVLGGPGAPELLDGPWGTRDAALKRAQEIEGEGRGSWRIVLIGTDGAATEAPE